MTETDRDEAPPASPEPAEPEEPQTSVHEQPVRPERDDEAEDERPAGYGPASVQARCAGAV